MFVVGKRSFRLCWRGENLVHLLFDALDYRLYFRCTSNIILLVFLVKLEYRLYALFFDAFCSLKYKNMHINMQTVYNATNFC